MKPTLVNPGKAFALIALALAIGAMGIYVADADDAPGAAVIGILLMIVVVVLGVKAARNRLPAWAARTALAVGALIAAFAAFLTHATVVAAPLFAQPQDVPSIVEPAPSPQWAAGAERARSLYAQRSPSKTCLDFRSQSAPAATSSGPKGSAGGTSKRARPSPRTRDSTLARRRPWSLRPPSRRSG